MTPEQIKNAKKILDDVNTEAVFLMAITDPQTASAICDMSESEFAGALISLCMIDDQIAHAVSVVANSVELEAKLKSMKKKEQQRLENGQNSELN